MASLRSLFWLLTCLAAVLLTGMPCSGNHFVGSNCLVDGLHEGCLHLWLGARCSSRLVTGGLNGAPWLPRLRGGQAEEPGGGEVNGADCGSDDGSSCDWYRPPVPGDISTGPPLRQDSDHAPWLDSYRQAYFEYKLHNRTLVRTYQESGKPPPRCIQTVNFSDHDPLEDLFFDYQAPDQPLIESWEQYWAEWEAEWAEPPDGGSDIAQQRYKMPHITDQLPIMLLARISVTEKPIFSTRVFPDSIPEGWPEALGDVLHDCYDEVKRVMDLNLLLLEACNVGNIEVAVQVLREGALIHTGDSANQYMTPLHHAAFEGHIELIHVLVSEQGALVDRTTLGGETALHKAVQGRQSLAVQALLQLGADPNIRSGLSGCPRGKQPGMNWTPLFRASLLGLTDVVRMLVKGGGEVTPLSTVGWTPLHYAATWAHNETVEALLELGADPLVATTHGGHTGNLLTVYLVCTQLR